MAAHAAPLEQEAGRFWSSTTYHIRDHLHGYGPFPSVKGGAEWRLERLQEAEHRERRAEKAARTGFVAFGQMAQLLHAKVELGEQHTVVPLLSGTGPLEKWPVEPSG